MPNVFETLKAQQIAADTVKAEARRLEELRLEQENLPYRQRGELERKKRAPRLKAYDDLTPVVEKVLHDFGSVLQHEHHIDYHVRNGVNDIDREEGMFHIISFNWTLGVVDENPYSHPHTNEKYYQPRYSVELLFSDTKPLHLQCVELPIYPERYEIYKEKQEKLLEPVNCGFSENELANALYQLYSDQIRRWDKKMQGN